MSSGSAISCIMCSGLNENVGGGGTALAATASSGASGVDAAVAKVLTVAGLTRLAAARAAAATATAAAAAAAADRVLARVVRSLVVLVVVVVVSALVAAVAALVATAAAGVLVCGGAAAAVAADCAASSTGSAYRHMGHVWLCLASHGSRHGAWYQCSHGICTAASSTTNASLQITHYDACACVIATSHARAHTSALASISLAGTGPRLSDAIASADVCGKHPTNETHVRKLEPCHTGLGRDSCRYSATRVSAQTHSYITLSLPGTTC
jgi:hypothetical protein